MIMYLFVAYLTTPFQLRVVYRIETYGAIIMTDEQERTRNETDESFKINILEFAWNLRENM
jgi:hypothetical protein